MACSKESGNSNANLEIFCDPCRIANEHVTALCYCGECDEYLCKTCNQVHQRLAATRDHVVKQNSDLPKTRPSKGETTCLTEKCLVHMDQLIDHYCSFHEELCCGICLSTTHNKCQAVTSIPEYLKTVDMAKEVANLKCKMQGLVDDVSDTSYRVHTNLNAVELNHELARSKMLELKTSVFKRIEETYSKLDEELNKIMEKDLSKIQPYKKKCDAIKFDVGTIESYLKGSIKNDKHRLFLTVKKTESKISSNRTDLQEIRHNIGLKVTRYSFEPNSRLTDLKSNLGSFGTFEIQENAFKSAKLDKTLRACETDEKNRCCVTGLAVLTENTLVVADHKNETVKLIDIEEDKILAKITLESAPWDVTAISDKQVAVTVPDREKVNILSLSEDKTLHNLPDKQIIVNRKCYGVTFANDKLFLTIPEPPKIEAYSFINGKLVLSVNLDNQKPAYITTNYTQSRIYVSDYRNGRRIKELDIDDLKQTDTLSTQNDVTGMAVDKTGSLYCCLSSYYRHIDVMCIEKGQGCYKRRTELISDSTRNEFFKCLAFNDETSRLFVGADGDEIAVYYVV